MEQKVRNQFSEAQTAKDGYVTRLLSAVRGIEREQERLVRDARLLEGRLARTVTALQEADAGFRGSLGALRELESVRQRLQRRAVQPMWGVAHHYHLSAFDHFAARAGVAGKQGLNEDITEMGARLPAPPFPRDTLPLTRTRRIAFCHPVPNSPPSFP